MHLFEYCSLTLVGALKMHEIEHYVNCAGVLFSFIFVEICFLFFMGWVMVKMALHKLSNDDVIIRHLINSHLN